MWANFTAKIKAFIGQLKTIKPPAVAKPDFSGAYASAKTTLDGVAKRIEPKHLVYFALILLPAIVGLGAYYGIVDSQVKLEAAQLPENRLARMSISFTADNFVKYAGRGNKEVTALFIEAGMSPDAYRKNDGFTPLHAAAAYGQTAVVRQLLDKGADINVRDKDGQTALMKAVWNSHAKVVTALLQNGANVTVNDSNGDNVVNMARARNDRRVLTALVAAGITELKDALEKVDSVPKANEKMPGDNETKQQVVRTIPKHTQPPAFNRPSATVSQPAGQFTLATGYAGAIGVGTSVDHLYQQFGKQAVSAGEEFFAGRAYPVLRAYDGQEKVPALTVYFALNKQTEDKVITAIRVFDDRYKTTQGIGVGTTLGELRQTGTLGSIQYTDTLYAIARDSKIRYELDFSTDNMPVAWLNGGDTNTLPDNMKIKSIFIF
ncbi:ankyrin repeat domain-containing protein [Sporomusa sphaeroides]|uniref:Ankyrin repeat protein n=1 Tax=Sporomusa sphaeroides DSM 2875 TaxID=1337886 RepID=A0ABP2CDJ0_9FIRM|nr:ankyrin repeat domain-containing protein [Sporomusa sphaeroides]OLS57281.1 ankyrin repeat protein [Sporomusa sphaeroides DSM 2875]CVK21886.1 Ankyrin repeat protein [Sporomusa sphaeroides DSM 2875]